MDSGVESAEKRIRFLLDRIGGSKASAEDKREVEAWVGYLRARGIVSRTIAKHLYCLEKFMAWLPEGTSLKHATREDVQAAVGRVEGSDYAPETKHVTKVIVKAFYKHLLGDDEFYPKQVSWIKTTLAKNKRKLPEDMLSEEEVLRMIKASGSARNRALIALLYDSGMRVGELLSLRMKDVDLDGEVAHVTVNGKTGMRRIPIMFSAPYLSSYIDTSQSKRPGDTLFTSVGSWLKKNWPITESGVRALLMETARAAGIRKRVYPHLFRHSRATFYANRLTEQQLKALFGWTGDSRMASTYVHLSGRDIDSAVLRASGREVKEEFSKPKLSVKVCPRCRYENAVSAVHCMRCGAALDVSNTMRDEEERKALMEAMLEAAKDPDFQRDMLEYMRGGKKR